MHTLLSGRGMARKQIATCAASLGDQIRRIRIPGVLCPLRIISPSASTTAAFNQFVRLIDLSLQPAPLSYNNLYIRQPPGVFSSSCGVSLARAWFPTLTTSSQLHYSHEVSKISYFPMECNMVMSYVTRMYPQLPYHVCRSLAVLESACLTRVCLLSSYDPCNVFSAQCLMV